MRTSVMMASRSWASTSEVRSVDSSSGSGHGAQIKDITTIEMKKPLLFAGYINFRMRSGETFRVYTDHKKAYIHLEQLLKLYYPEILRIE